MFLTTTEIYSFKDSHRHCYISRVMDRPAALVLPGNLLAMQGVKPTSALLNQNLHVRRSQMHCVPIKS